MLITEIAIEKYFANISNILVTSGIIRVFCKNWRYEILGIITTVLRILKMLLFTTQQNFSEKSN